MEKYERPMIINFEDATEGIYAASGAEDGGTAESKCWTISVTKSQADAGGYARFRLYGEHLNTVHISLKSYITVTFNKPISEARFEGFDVTGISGCTVSLERVNHANAYVTKDIFDSDLSVWPVTASDLPELDSVVATISCEGTENVQGGNDFIR